MLEDGVTGWIAPTPDAEGLAAALRRALATAPDTLSEMGRRAAQSIREICDKQKVLEPHSWLPSAGSQAWCTPLY